MARFTAIVILWVTAACQGLDRPQTNPTAGAVSTLAPAALPVGTPTALRTPPSLPEPFRSTYLNPLDVPQTYVDDTCSYLRNRWNPANAAPGTVVMIVMLHSINRARAEEVDALTALQFARMMEDLHEQHFQAISMKDLASFLEQNAKIPVRSVVLIQDGRRYADNFNTHFRSYWESWGWPVVNAWDHQGETSDALWQDYAALAHEGWVDFEVYGPTFDPSSKQVTADYLTAQLQIPMELLREHIGRAPIGVVWPNGFTSQSASIARQQGYRLGFTANARGPVMYNWVPLSAAEDNSRPAYQPEVAVGDPLMTLPRYWPTQVHSMLDGVRAMGEEAAVYADQVRSTELDYYDIVCAGKYGPIPGS